MAKTFHNVKYDTPLQDAVDFRSEDSSKHLDKQEDTIDENVVAFSHQVIDALNDHLANKKTLIEDKTLKNGVGMQRTVGLVGGIAIVVGTMIGSGIFASPRSVVNNAGSVGSTLHIWCGSGFIAMFGAMCYVELGTMIPKSGGEYAYFLEAYGEVIAFMFSYASALILRPASFAAISVACGDYLIEPFYGEEENKTKAVLAKVIGAVVIGNHNSN